MKALAIANCPTGPHIRFYAAVPLKSHDGKVMGSLCVLDTRPRQITEKQKEMLHWIAEVVTTAIELKDATPPAEPASTKAEIGFASS
jgi:GAF domain-containing protein